MSTMMFKWMRVVENISEVKKIRFDDVFDMELLEFINFMNYIKYKNEEIKKEYGKKG